MLKIYFEKLFLIFTVIVFCLFSAEIALRILGRMPSNTASGELETFQDSFRLKKNFKKVINWPSFSFTIYTNSFGFRVKEIGERNIYNKPYMTFFGDSMTFANGVDYQDSFVGIFHELASRNKGIEVINMAIGGHHFHDQEKLFIDFTKNISPKPQCVIIVFNEFMISRFERSHKDHFVKDGYLFNKKEWRLAYLITILSNRSSVYFSLRNNVRQFQKKYFDFGDKRPTLYLEVYSKNNHLNDTGAIKRFRNNLNRFERYCQGINTNLVYLYIPTADSFNLNKILIQYGKDPENYNADYYEKLIEDYCIEKKRRFITLKPILKEQYEKGEPLRFKTDGHFNKFANRIVGEYIYRKVFAEEQESRLAF